MLYVAGMQHLYITTLTVMHVMGCLAAPALYIPFNVIGLLMESRLSQIQVSNPHIYGSAKTFPNLSGWPLYLHQPHRRPELAFLFLFPLFNSLSLPSSTLSFYCPSPPSLAAS